MDVRVTISYTPSCKPNSLIDSHPTLFDLSFISETNRFLELEVKPLILSGDYLV